MDVVCDSLNQQQWGDEVAELGEEAVERRLVGQWADQFSRAIVGRRDGEVVEGGQLVRAEMATDTDAVADLGLGACMHGVFDTSVGSPDDGLIVRSSTFASRWLEAHPPQDG